MLSISRTRPFSDFQKAAGISTFHINTIVVGLELVALGGEKPDGLNVKWKPPNNPRDAVEQTKKFILLAILTHVVDAFDVLLRDYADLRWTGFDRTLIDVLKKAAHKPDKKAYSLSERAEELLRHLAIDQSDSLAALDLMASWRNSLVHAGRGKWILSEQTCGRLLGQASTFAQRYAGIDIKRTLSLSEIIGGRR